MGAEGRASETARGRRDQARFMGRPQQTFWTIATFPQRGHRKPAMAAV
jgi:hypothetical protein